MPLLLAGPVWIQLRSALGILDAALEGTVATATAAGTPLHGTN